MVDLPEMNTTNNTTVMDKIENIFEEFGDGAYEDFAETITAYFGLVIGSYANRGYHYRFAIDYLTTGNYLKYLCRKVWDSVYQYFTVDEDGQTKFMGEPIETITVENDSTYDYKNEDSPISTDGDFDVDNPSYKHNSKSHNGGSTKRENYSFILKAFRNAKRNTNLMFVVDTYFRDIIYEFNIMY